MSLIDLFKVLIYLKIVCTFSSSANFCNPQLLKLCKSQNYLFAVCKKTKDYIIMFQAKLVGTDTDSHELNWERLIQGSDYRHFKMKGVFPVGSDGIRQDDGSCDDDGYYPFDSEREKYVIIQKESRLALKLRAVYVIICCICYVKNRDLKRRRPFSATEVKKLKRELPCDRRGHVVLPSSAFPPGMAEKLIALSPPTQARIQSALMRGSNQVNVATGQRQQSTAAASNFKSGPQTQRRLNMKMRKASPTSRFPQSSRLETWEELMAIGENGDWASSGTSQESIQAQKRNLTNFMKTWVPGSQRDPSKSKRGAADAYLMSDFITPWQKMTLPSASEEEDILNRKLHVKKRY
eukprot:m.180575 g.180575  ORF g.180575 m.180575 type:complete len:350 (+) comp39256_c0_seq33:1020-2069(+)